MADVQKMELSKIIKRLEMIKSLITMEEEEEISTHISKLEQLALSAEVEDIISCLKDKLYSKAVTAIEAFINHKNGITIYLDPEIDALKLEIKALEAAINFLSEEKADLKKLINDFSLRLIRRFPKTQKVLLIRPSRVNNYILIVSGNIYLKKLILFYL